LGYLDTKLLECHYHNVGNNNINHPFSEQASADQTIIESSKFDKYLV